MCPFWSCETNTWEYFFRNVKKIQSVKKNFEKKIFSTEIGFQCRLRKYKRFCVYTNFFFNFWKNYKSQTWNCSVVCLRQVIFGGNLLNSHATQLGNPCASYTTWGVPEIFSWTKTDCGNTFLKNVVIHGEKQWREWAMDWKTTHINL